MVNKEIEIIHNSLVNDQKEQMVKQIDEYGDTFWEDYKYWLPDLEWFQGEQYKYFMDATISYFKIKRK